MMVGSDNMGVEVNPNPDTQLSLPVHQIMLVVNGIHLVEALKLDELTAAHAYEFAFVVQPLKIRRSHGLDDRADRDSLTRFEERR